MRFQANHAALDQGRPLAVANVPDDFGQDLVHRLEPSAVERMGPHPEALGDTMNFRRGLAGLGHADGVAVVLHDEEHRESFALSPVQCLEELSFACCAFAGRYVDKLALSVLLAGFGHADGGEILGAGTSGLRHQLQFTGRPLLRHVDAAGVRVSVAAEHPQEEVLEVHAEGNGDSLFPIIGIEPVVPGLEEHRDSGLDLLVPASGSVERAFALLDEDLHALFDVVDVKHLVVEFADHRVGDDPFFDWGWGPD